MTELVGKKHHQLLKKLADWQSNSRSKTIAVIEGFSGTGKTFVAREFTSNLSEKVPSVFVELRDTGDILNQVLLDLAQELYIVGISDLSDAVNKGDDLKLAFQKILFFKKVVIVLDEFQNSFTDTNKPLKDLIELFGKIANRPNMQGRLLLLTNRAVERNKWSEFFEFFSLEPLAETEAERLLDVLLQESNKEKEVPIERRKDVVNWLGRYPRALTVLVSSLEYESLDTLIGENPDSWALKDRKVSPELLHKLEEKLLQGILARLFQHTVMLLRRLAVYRKPFVIEALENAATNRTDATALREDLVNAFLLRRQGTSNYFALNEIAREIALYQLGQTKEIKTAHSLAADHYYRHFKAKEIKASGGQLGGYFIEARYHLAKAGRFDDISQLSMLFTSYLKQEMGMKSPVPSNNDELEERIALLTGLLEHCEIVGLEYYLAKLLQKRNNEGDLQLAWSYAQRAAYSSDDAEVWRVFVQLELEVNGLNRAIVEVEKGLTKVPANWYSIRLYYLAKDLLIKNKQFKKAIKLLQKGISEIPTDKNIWELYFPCADLLAKDNRIKEAIILLEKGIAEISVDKEKRVLYTLCAELLVKDNRIKEAIILLEKGIAEIPVNSRQFIYTVYAELLEKDNRIKEAIILLEKGIAEIPVDKDVRVLYTVYAELLAKDNRIKEAIILLEKGIAEIPIDNGRHSIIGAMLCCCAIAQDKEMLKHVINVIGGTYIENTQKILGQVLLAQLDCDWQKAAEISANQNNSTSAMQEAFSWLCANDIEKAYAALQNFHDLENKENNTYFWLKTFVCLRFQKHDEANEAITIYLGRSITEKLTEKFLLQLWDEQDCRLPHLFPVLPPSLTGLSESVARLPLMSPVLPQSHQYPLTHTVYVEGITDELYLKKTIEVFDKYTLGLDIKCRGKQDKDGAKGSGSAMLDKFVDVHKLHPEELPQKTTVLYDSDTKKKQEDYGTKLRVRCMPENAENERYKKGIENLLTLPTAGFPAQDFINYKETTFDYGDSYNRPELQKRKLCDWICENLSVNEQCFYLQKFEKLLDNIAE